MDQKSSLPEFFRIRQKTKQQPIDNVAGAVIEALDASTIRQQVQPGQTVAIAVGSRGISNLKTIVSTVVRFVEDLGGDPIIVPAMGSHGGATPEGQTALLASLGIDSSVGCQVRASMETIVIGQADDDVSIHFDKVASEADHIIIVNRVKPHTRLTGRFESGLIKMSMIGLGNHLGASLYHQIFGRHDYRLDTLAPKIVPMIVERMPITLGLAIVEDAFDNTSLIEAVEPKNFLSREPELLSIARTRMPRLPFDDIDLLIVDTIGKEFSGTGMDTNVIGRKAHDKHPGPDEIPKIREIYVRSLSEKTNGNAAGIGIAEYCHRRVVDAMDREVTRINCVTSAHVTAGAIPLTFDSDRAVLDAVLSQVGKERADEQKWVWIANTLHLGQLACSRRFWDEVQGRKDLQILSDPSPLEFDSHGDLLTIA